MIYKQLNIYECLNQEIDRSNIKRIKWKNILGMSLTEYITNIRTLYDLNANQVYDHISGVLTRNNFQDPEIFRKLKISVSARIVEQEKYKKTIERF